MRILIVDDSSYICLFCRQVLSRLGNYEIVGECHDGIEAVNQAVNFSPDLVIMDVALPRKNGLEAAELIIQTNPNTKVLAISAVDEDWVKDKAIESGCYAFLAKPFDHNQLIEYVEKANSESEERKYG
ncbi:MAG: response regulator [Pseudomonadota bacterium]